MSYGGGRPLNTCVLAKDFVVDILKFSVKEEMEEAIADIVREELILKSTNNKSTVTSEDYRITYITQSERDILREKIIDELINQKRLEKDDDICLGRGGVLPSSALKYSSEAYIIMGAPASGKSTIASRLADKIGAAIIDSDFAKRKFSEFNIGASIVHEESSQIIGEVSGRFLEKKANLIYPKIGDNYTKILKLAQSIFANGYTVNIILVHLDREKAVKRAYFRYKETHRYVPLTLIYDVYANAANDTYYKLKENNENNIISNFVKLDADVQKGDPLKLCEKASFGKQFKRIYTLVGEN